MKICCASLNGEVIAVSDDFELFDYWIKAQYNEFGNVFDVFKTSVKKSHYTTDMEDLELVVDSFGTISPAKYALASERLVGDIMYRLDETIETLNYVKPADKKTAKSFDKVIDYLKKQRYGSLESLNVLELKEYHERYI